MSYLKRIAAFILAAVMLTAIASGCATQDTTAPDGSSSSAVSSEKTVPATISVLFRGDNTPPSSNMVLKAIEEKTGIKVAPIYVPIADYQTKLSALLAAKSLPDIVRIENVSMANEFKENGALAELTDIIGENMPTYYPEAKDTLQNNPLNKDGKVYALVSSKLRYATNLNIRTDWLEKLGLTMPTDLDSLYNVLYAFTNSDPDGNGAKDTIGLAASVNAEDFIMFSTILGAYGIPANMPIQLEDGTVTTFLKHKNFLEAAKYYNKLYKDGLIDPDFATIPIMNSFGKLWDGKAGAMDFQCVGPTNNWMPGRYTEATPPTFDFATIKGPDGTAGVREQYPQYATSIVVTANSKNPAAALRLLDFFYSEEGDELLLLGVEGTHYKWADKENGKYEWIPPFDDSATNRNDGVYVYWDNLLTPENHIEIRTLNKQSQEGVALAFANSTIAWPFITTPFEADTLYRSTLKQIENEVFCTLVMSTGDLDAAYAQAIQRWNNEGGTQWEQEATAAYKSQQ